MLIRGRSSSALRPQQGIERSCAAAVGSCFRRQQIVSTPRILSAEPCALPTCVGHNTTSAARPIPRKFRAMSTPAVDANEAKPYTPERTLICTAITASTMEQFLADIDTVTATGVDLIELRLDFIQEFNPEKDLDTLMKRCTIPYIVTYRPAWEGGNYGGPEPERLAALKYAALRGAPYIDVEFKAAPMFFAGRGDVPISTKVILSSHDFEKTPPLEELQKRAITMRAVGADIVKIAAMANDIGDAARVLSLLQNQTGPTIALSMGEKGIITRLCAAKYGGYLTFATAAGGAASAPGQPSVDQLRGLFNLYKQQPSTKLFGIIGNPVHHSRSPLIHNTAFQHIGFDGVYIPLLVDDLASFLEAYQGHDFQAFSVTIPHKEAALRAANSVDPVAAEIGAVNTLVRQEDGTLKGYNTDWSAAISAIERKLGGTGVSTSGGSLLEGKRFVVIGAGGAGRALAFGAASRGAQVVIANRNRSRAEQLAEALGGRAEVVDWEDFQSGKVRGDILANTTSVGMVPAVDETPAPTAALSQYKLVFDAVYTPRETRLLREAAAAGCATVDGVEMFVGQAADQFRFFTGEEPPLDVMEEVLLGGK